MNIEENFYYKHFRFLLHYASGKLVQTSDSGVGWIGVGDGDGEICTGMGIFLWGRDGDGKYYMGTG